VRVYPVGDCLTDSLPGRGDIVRRVVESFVAPQCTLRYLDLLHVQSRTVEAVADILLSSLCYNVSSVQFIPCRR